MIFGKIFFNAIRYNMATITTKMNSIFWRSFPQTKQISFKNKKTIVCVTMNHCRFYHYFVVIIFLFCSNNNSFLQFHKQQQIHILYCIVLLIPKYYRTHFPKLFFCIISCGYVFSSSSFSSSIYASSKIMRSKAFFSLWKQNVV